MSVLYAFAGLLYLIAYYVVRHRDRIVEDQLARVFPDRSARERRQLHKRFMRAFCDVGVEILKSISMSADDLRQRVRLIDIELALAPLRAGQSVMLVTSHLCNWEWLLHGVVLGLEFPVDAAYKPLHDAWAERLMLTVRSRFGARLVPAKNLLSHFLQQRNTVRALAINADQAPVTAEQRYWTKFLGQDTAFYVGAEQIARATRLPMIFLAMRRIRRGHYEVQFMPLWDGVERLPPGEVTERYARLCEQEVYRAPADWLWTYRRWKLPKPLYGVS